MHVDTVLRCSTACTCRYLSIDLPKRGWPKAASMLDEHAARLGELSVKYKTTAVAIVAAAAAAADAGSAPPAALAPSGTPLVGGVANAAACGSASSSTHVANIAGAFSDSPTTRRQQRSTARTSGIPRSPTSPPAKGAEGGSAGAAAVVTARGCASSVASLHQVLPSLVATASAAGERGANAGVAAKGAAACGSRQPGMGRAGASSAQQQGVHGFFTRVPQQGGQQQAHGHQDGTGAAPVTTTCAIHALSPLPLNGGLTPVGDAGDDSDDDFETDSERSADGVVVALRSPRRR